MRKLYITILFSLVCLLGASAASAQRYDNTVQGPRGPIANAYVAVCTQPANVNVTPCTPLATLYTDATLSTPCTGTLVVAPSSPGQPCSNPMLSDTLGNYHFYAAQSSTFTVQIYGPQVNPPFPVYDQTVPIGSPLNGVTCKNFENVRCVDAANSAGWSGSDFGAWVNSALTDCASTGCVVAVAAGSYTQTTTINYPTDGREQLTFDSGAVISYTGSGCSVSINSPTNVNLRITGGGRINGTSSGTAGICLTEINQALIQGITINGFTNGAAIKSIGANTVEVNHATLEGSEYGLWLVGSGTGFSSNAFNVHDNLIQNNTSWGVFLDASGDGGGSGPPQLVKISHNVFESNGTNGNANTGQAFLQTCDACHLDGNYMEYVGGETKTQSVLVGDVSHSPSNTLFIGNNFVSTGTTSTISSHSFGLQVYGNTELATNTNFLNHISAGGFDNTYYGPNFVNSTNAHAGTGVGLSTLSIASSGSYTFYIGPTAGGTATITGTGACATNSTQKGGAWAGQATCTGTTGASTFIITPGSTAPNGWSCTASDLTTAANILRQSVSSTTACTIAGTVNANDVLTFTAVAY